MISIAVAIAYRGRFNGEHYIHLRQGMHQNMIIKIRNWKLAILALIFFCFFVGLGVWQYNRAKLKESLIKTYAERTALAPQSGTALKEPNDWRFYRVSLTGTYDNAHTFLLDNKTQHGKVGYEVYTPFHAKDVPEPILVDRGFIPIGDSRDILPTINEVSGDVTIIGMLNVPPVYKSLGKLTDSATNSWPLRIEYINLPELGNEAGLTFYPYVLNAQPNDPGAFDVEWKVVTTTPERHMGYAVQWFALALTLLIIFAVLNWRKVDGQRGTSPRRSPQKKTGTTSKKKR